ncbi:MAG: NHL repeat-containing protein [bacterium]
MKRFMLLFLISILSFELFPAETTLIVPPFQHSLGYHKANSSIAKMVLGKKVDFQRIGGIYALKLNQLDDKTSKNDDAILSLFGLNNHQIVYNVGLKKLKTYGKQGRARLEDRFFYPFDISVTPTGVLYLSDMYNFRLMKFKYDEDDSLRFIREFGKIGSDSFSLDMPKGIDYSAVEDIYICDSRNNRIMVVDSTLKPKMIFDNINSPHSIAVIDYDKRYMTIKGPLSVIVSSGRNHLYKLGPHGQILAEVFPQDLTLFNQIDFNFIDYDYHGNVWVTDTVNSCVHKFDNDLKYITSFGSEGSGNNQFIKPEGITIYRKFGQVFIAERTGFQYYWIGVDGYLKEFTPSVISDTTEGLTISLYTTEQCNVTIEITKKGKKVRTLTQNLKRSIGLNYILWDLKNEEGNLITEKGRYDMRITLEALYSSRGYFSKEIKHYIEKI